MSLEFFICLTFISVAAFEKATDLGFGKPVLASIKIISISPKVFMLKYLSRTLIAPAGIDDW